MEIALPTATLAISVDFSFHCAIALGMQAKEYELTSAAQRRALYLDEEEGDLGLFSTYARGYVVGLRVGHVLGESSLS